MLRRCMSWRWGGRVRRALAAMGERGQVIVISALLLPVLIGLTGLALDVGLLMVQRTERQRTADAAALAGAQYLMYNFGQSGAETTAEQTACTYAQNNGFAGVTC